MIDAELHYLEIRDLSEAIRSKAMSPVEVTMAQLERIEALDGGLHSFACRTADLALSQARQAEREIQAGQYRGPLHGVPIAIKDLCWVKDVPCAAGMPIFQDFVPDENATVVDRLISAGAVILGKLQMTESAFAYHHPEITPPVNPWHSPLWPGASSSGSGVATAAGLCYASLGSDTGGSIRFPSAACGLTGLKPSWGRVSRHGVFELAASLDHVGPMARSAYDAALMLQAIAGADDRDPSSSRDAVPNYLDHIGGGLAGLRIGIDASWNALGADMATTRTVQAAIDACSAGGAEIVELRFPDPESINASWIPLCAVQAAVAHAATFPSRKDRYGPPLADLLGLGGAIAGTEYQKMMLARVDFSSRVQRLFDDVDLLIVPVQPEAALTNESFADLVGDPTRLAGLIRFTVPFDMSGNPTLTLPGGLAGDATPIGFQFVAKLMGEAALLRAGHAFQTITTWHRNHPDLTPKLDMAAALH